MGSVADFNLSQASIYCREAAAPDDIATARRIKAAMSNEENTYWCHLAINQCVRWNLADDQGTYFIPEVMDWHCDERYQGALALEGNTKATFMKTPGLIKRKGVNQDGYCYLCDKLVYMIKDSLNTHLNSNEHTRKMPAERERREIQKKQKDPTRSFAYNIMPFPECPWLMYLPYQDDVKYPELKCLMCDKFVKDDDNHRLDGPKDHARKIKNNGKFQRQWYEQHYSHAVEEKRKECIMRWPAFYK